MSVSTHRVLAFIKSQGGYFTLHSVVHSFESLGKTRKRKKRKGSIKNRLQKVGEILQALHSIGFLTKEGRRYLRNPRFRLEGIIKVNTNGNAILESPDGSRIIITKEFINKAHSHDFVHADLIDYSHGHFHGKVISVIRQGRDQYVARVTELQDDIVSLITLDMPEEIEVCARYRGEAPPVGSVAQVTMTGAKIAGVPECRIEESFPFESERYDIERLRIKYSLPDEHPEYKELASASGIIGEQEAAVRNDYRSLYSITIDGEFAKDFDDAISLEKTALSSILYVHIADVSYFVKKGTILDREALSRGTSSYLGKTVIPMLPELLSNNLCSLKQDEDRRALTARIEIDNDGKLIGAEYSRSIIRVDKRLTYKEAHKLITSKVKIGLSKRLKGMFALAKLLKKNRLAEGRIDLNLTDHELIYDNDNISEIRFAPRYASHSVVEEFMLSANEIVSRTLRENNIPALYRIHEDISKEKFISMVRFLKSLGLRIKKNKNSGRAIQEILEKVSGEEYEQVVNFIVLKSMMQASYSEQPLGHFGLGFEDYTHFTSPIRRYPDLIVHRCLKSYIDKKKHVYNNDELKIIGEKASGLERIAQKAERDLTKIKSCRLMAGKIGDTFDGIVSGIAKAGLFVTLTDRPIEGMVPLRLLTDDYYLVQEDDYTIVGRRRGKRYGIGDQLTIRLVDVSIELMRIDFEVVK